MSVEGQLDSDEDRTGGPLVPHGHTTDSFPPRFNVADGIPGLACAILGMVAGWKIGTTLGPSLNQA